MQSRDELLKEWALVRAETNELLDSLPSKKITYRPDGEKWQTLAYQFACIGRTQLVYARALQKGVLEFADFNETSLPDKQAIKTKAQLQELLAWSDSEWLSAVENGMISVKWPGKGSALSRAAHIYRLISHERLHQGQMISYFTLGGFELPHYFKQHWTL